MSKIPRKKKKTRNRFRKYQCHLNGADEFDYPSMSSSEYYCYHKCVGVGNSPPPRPETATEAGGTHLTWNAFLFENIFMYGYSVSI